MTTEYEWEIEFEKTYVFDETENGARSHIEGKIPHWMSIKRIERTGRTQEI